MPSETEPRAWTDVRRSTGRRCAPRTRRDISREIMIDASPPTRQEVFAIKASLLSFAAVEHQLPRLGEDRLLLPTNHRLQAHVGGVQRGDHATRGFAIARLGLLAHAPMVWLPEGGLDQPWVTKPWHASLRRCSTSARSDASERHHGEILGRGAGNGATIGW